MALAKRAQQRLLPCFKQARFSSNKRKLEPSFIEQHLSEPFQAALLNGKRVGKVALLGFVGASIVAGTAYQGLHIWVENIGLAPHAPDEATREWQWDVEAERWSGSRTGTDPGLGFWARHLCRLAWLSQRLSSHDDFIVVENSDRSFTTLPADLLQTQRLLKSVITIAEARKSKLDAHTLPQLLLRRAAVLERIGPSFLPETKQLYEKVWNELDGQGLVAARIAWKLGELNSRLGEGDVSLDWWSKALYLCSNASSVALLPDSPPTSPLAQRVMASTLVSLSGYYATTNRLREAQDIEQSAGQLLSSITTSYKQPSSSAQELHRATLLQQASVLAIHHAEVLYKMKATVGSSLENLAAAASSAEICALSLTSAPQTVPVQPSTTDPLQQDYFQSSYLKDPATSLLRNARRTAAVAWNLMGLLHEREKRMDPKMVAECYDRALRWSSLPSKDGNAVGEPTEYILSSEWSKMVDNYMRAKSLTTNT